MHRKTNQHYWPGSLIRTGMRINSTFITIRTSVTISTSTLRPVLYAQERTCAETGCTISDAQSYTVGSVLDRLSLKVVVTILILYRVTCAKVGLPLWIFGASVYKMIVNALVPSKIVAVEDILTVLYDCNFREVICKQSLKWRVAHYFNRGELTVYDKS